MKNHTILSLALCSLLMGGTSAYAGQGTVTAIYVDTNCGGFVQFSDAPTIWVGVPQSASALVRQTINNGVGGPQTATASISTASILFWQTLNNAFALGTPVTYNLSGSYCGDQHPALLELFAGNPK